ncbi:outer membrane protein assembly factor BamB family protein [Halorussus amylolyticus]|uniref:outer membrane protein assembly factor BamB family protein n=1 Tax=Halorussus amylolyticus TaxID=1126242 RepID=UPI00104A8372|nr:PQQ-binding-like beta-propeller repeat protein [Halorussus amylolyticus]
MPSRRTLLSALGASAVSAALAGCAALPDDPLEPTPDEPPESGVDHRPDPGDHIFGADGEWSSFGCNASNTREVADGKAPVDGVEEQWRTEVFQMTAAEPIVADGRVYQLTVRDLAVYDASDGSQLWTKSGAGGPPLVVGETAYLGANDSLLALDAATGETLWERTFEKNAIVRSPATYSGDRLYVPAGETIHRVDSETGDVDWSRRLFGTLLGSPAIYSGYSVAVASEAGTLYLLGPDGTGAGEWNLPAVPEAPPTTDTDRIYVNCFDGRTYAADLERESKGTFAWDADSGVASAGLAVKSHVYATGTGGLSAIDPDTGERAWKHDTGDWRWTAPALGRDTLFVGGDALYALDPTPSGLLGDGPALRFEESFFGRVGPGPVLNDGTLYVVAQTSEESYHLLALE